MESLLQLVPYIILLPLAGFLINGLLGLSSESYRRMKPVIGAIGTLSVFVPFLMALYLFIAMPAGATPDSFTLFTWIAAGELTTEFGYRVDQLSLVMALVVTGVGSLIHVYSMGYMAHDEGYWKYFAYLNLFIFAMMNLVMADNLLLLFLGWEGVGLCSYLLIGFWYTDLAKSSAAMKAFLYNRVGDFAFLIAMFLVFQTVGSLNYDVIFANLEAFSGELVFWIGFLMLIGATGKSAQIPLFVWLPDAMAGPTPVSALIHAATMVTAGVYLFARMSEMFMASPELMLLVAVVGALTAIVAATIAMTQYDIKKVLAYSTVSQLGFMFLALGSGAYIVAIFHVVTHAFFKACLFLGSGSVIHTMEHVEHKLHDEGSNVHFDPQDMRNMGGLKDYMPSTYWTFLIATIAIAGIPPLAGFFSKDQILVMTFNAGMGAYGPVYLLLWAMTVMTAFMTAFYMFRLTLGTFHGPFKLPKRFSGVDHASGYLHESPFNMTFPLWVLGGLSVIGGLIGIPNFAVATFTGEADVHLLQSYLGHAVVQADLILSKAVEWALLIGAVVVAAAGVYTGYRLYGQGQVEESDTLLEQRFGTLYRIWSDKYHLDEIYEGTISNPVVRFSDRVLAVFDMKVVDGLVNGVGATVRFFGSIFRYIQTGVVQNYALMLVIGVILVFAMLLFG